jgi:hypothetical protein
VVVVVDDDDDERSVCTDVRRGHKTRSIDRWGVAAGLPMPVVGVVAVVVAAFAAVGVAVVGCVEVVVYGYR